MENEAAVHILDSESSDPVVRSTKRPLSTREQRPTCSKRQKKEMQEDVLLQKAIACMEKTGKVHQQKRDDDDIFGDYIASEMRAIQNVEMKRWVKFKIQSLLFSAHSGFAPQQSQAYPPSQPFAPQPHKVNGIIPTLVHLQVNGSLDHFVPLAPLRHSTMNVLTNLVHVHVCVCITD